MCEKYLFKMNKKWEINIWTVLGHNHLSWFSLFFYLRKPGQRNISHYLHWISFLKIKTIHWNSDFVRNMHGFILTFPFSNYRAAKFASWPPHPRNPAALEHVSLAKPRLAPRGRRLPGQAMYRRQARPRSAPPLHAGAREPLGPQFRMPCSSCCHRCPRRGQAQVAAATPRERCLRRIL